MKRALLCGALLAAVVAISPVAFAQGTKINFTPKAGTVAEYDTVITVTFEGTPLTIKAKSISTVQEVKANGDFVVQNEERGMVIELPGMDSIPVPDMDPSTTVFDKTGVPIEVQQPDASAEDLAASARMASISAFYLPEDLNKEWQVGDRYVREIPANTKLGTKAVRAEYTFEGTEKVGNWETAIFSFKVTETEGGKPQQISGKMHLSVTDGMTVKLEARFVDMVTPGAPEPVSGSISLTRTK
ncbi:MAG: hypothetical protein ACK4P3_02965 [Fimbriimonadaceae bacterium]